MVQVHHVETVKCCFYLDHIHDQTISQKENIINKSLVLAFPDADDDHYRQEAALWA